MAKCFVDKKPCDNECVLFRRGLRYNEDGKAPVPFEDCAINCLCDATENYVMRSIGIQKEMNEVRNSNDKLMRFLTSAISHAMRLKNDAS